MFTQGTTLIKNYFETRSQNKIKMLYKTTKIKSKFKNP